MTPVVVDGVMYVTSANECYALDAGAGREIWHYQRPRTKGLVGNAAGGVNRGVGVAGDRLFMVTDHAHVIALNRFTGALLWETEMADWHQNYNATGAPLAVGNLVVTGTSGGDEGVRGFVAAFDQATGKEVWRFWTVPRPGEPKAETWQGKGIEHPGATTWLTGTYDPELDTVYWPTGNPSPDLIGDDRGGDNLYSDSIVALDAKTGRLKWHFQFTPHDVWDYDAQETPALIDATWQNRPRKLLVQANRNGFFYVLDRTDGKFLLGKQYAKNVTWASGLTPEGRPMTVPNMEPSLEGKRVCPSLEGSSNWYSTSFNPATGLYYVQTNDKCGVFTKTPMEWEAGKGFMGGSFKQAPDEPAQRILRAIDIQTGRIVWELPQTGAVDSWGGTLSTAGGIVIFGEDSGSLMAADAASGKPLWSFQTSQLWKASPMTYMFDNKQYVAVAAGPNIIAFGLPTDTPRLPRALLQRGRVPPANRSAGRPQRPGRHHQREEHPSGAIASAAEPPTAACEAAVAVRSRRSRVGPVLRRGSRGDDGDGARQLHNPESDRSTGIAHASSPQPVVIARDRASRRLRSWSGRDSRRPDRRFECLTLHRHLLRAIAPLTTSNDGPQSTSSRRRRYHPVLVELDHFLDR